MAKRPDLTSHQRKIVDRYYAHRDTIMQTKLQELVSELYLVQADPSAGPKKADQLWKRVGLALAKARTEPPLPKSRVDKIMNDKDLEDLARLVSELSVA